MKPTAQSQAAPPASSPRATEPRSHPQWAHARLWSVPGVALGPRGLGRRADEHVQAVSVRRALAGMCPAEEGLAALRAAGGAGPRGSEREAGWVDGRGSSGSPTASGHTGDWRR